MLTIFYLFLVCLQIWGQKDWELQIEKNLLEVDQSTCQTSKNGIFRYWGYLSYPGKLKLILTGFSEATIAAMLLQKNIS